MDDSKFLPLGTIVQIKGFKHKVMITYRCAIEKGIVKNKMYDYAGCVYPDGFAAAPGKVLSFNNNDITNIIHMGYTDEKELEYLEELSAEKDEFNSNKGSLFGKSKKSR